MKDIIQNNNLGKFDMVTAFCSLYYLHDNDINNLVTYLSTITSTIVLQCNINVKLLRKEESTHHKASIEYNKSILQKNGFNKIKVIAPKKYFRPLIIGFT